MAQFNEDALKKQIKSGEFSRIYFIYGDEGFLKQHYANLICEKTVSKDFEDFNLKKLEGKDTSLNEIYDCISSFPMMSDYSCTLVKDYNLTEFIGDRGKVDEEFLSVITDMPETSVLVFWMDTIEVDDKSSKWSKVIKLIDEVGVCAKIDKRTRPALEKLLISSASKKDCVLSKECAAYIINLVGEDMATLQNELSKVCAYVKSGEISKSDIDATVIISVEAKIFQLSKMITKGESDNAYENLQNLFKLREEPIVILAVLSKAYVDMYRVKAAKEAGVPYKQLADCFAGNIYKTKMFTLDNAAADGNRYSMAQLKNALEVLSNADRRMKSTNEDKRIILEEVILRLLRL